MLILFLTLLFFSIDFFFKKFVQQTFSFNTGYHLIKNIVDLRLVHNTGAAFGMLRDKTLFLIFLGIILLAIFFVWARKMRYSFLRKIFISMILGGALCNLYDRIVFGYVIDYIDLGWWPVFNLSDTFISVGCILLIISYLHEDARKKKTDNLAKSSS